MKAWNVTQEQLETSAERAGVRLSNVRPDGRAIAFVLRTHGPTTSGLPVRWGRVSHIRNKDGSHRRVPGAVCWHGHREFMRDLFVTVPGCRLKSALADYRGREDFLAKYPATYDPDARPCDCDFVQNGDPDMEVRESDELAGRRLKDGAEWARDVIRRSHDLRELFGGLRWSTTLSQAGQLPQQTVEDAFKVDGTVPRWVQPTLVSSLAHGLYADEDLTIDWLVYQADRRARQSEKYNVRKGQKTLRPVMKYAREYDSDMLPALEQAAQTLGQLYAKREENPDPWTVTLSVAPTDWLRLATHSAVDTGSCYGNGCQNEEAKYVLGLHPFSFVALIRDGDGDVSARAWGFLDPDGGDAYVNNVYPGGRLNEYHVHNMIRQAISELTGTELEQAEYDAYVPNDGAWSIVYKNACERTYGDPGAVEKMIDHPGLAGFCQPHVTPREACPECGDIDEALVECTECLNRVCGYCTVEVGGERYCGQHRHEQCPDCREVFFPNGGSAECAGERCQRERCGPCVENVEQTPCSDCETPTCGRCAYSGRGGLRCRQCFIAEDDRRRQERLQRQQEVWEAQQRERRQRRAQQAPTPAEPGGERRFGNLAVDGGECECDSCERWRLDNGQPLLRPDLAVVPTARPERAWTGGYTWDGVDSSVNIEAPE